MDEGCIVLYNSKNNKKIGTIILRLYEIIVSVISFKLII